MYLLILEFSNESGDAWIEKFKAKKRPTKKQLDWYTKSIAGADIDGSECYLHRPIVTTIRLESLPEFPFLKKDIYPEVDFI